MEEVQPARPVAAARPENRRKARREQAKSEVMNELCNPGICAVTAFETAGTALLGRPLAADCCRSGWRVACAGDRRASIDRSQNATAEKMFREDGWQRSGGAAIGAKFLQHDAIAARLLGEIEALVGFRIEFHEGDAAAGPGDADADRDRLLAIRVGDAGGGDGDAQGSRPVY